jgi:hypothetical protein
LALVKGKWVMYTKPVLNSTLKIIRIQMSVKKNLNRNVCKNDTH